METPPVSICGNSITTNEDRKMIGPAKIEFIGYVPQSHLHLLPMCSGIYGVHRCHYSRASNMINIYELIYIGEANNLHERASSSHEKWYNWQNTLDIDSGEELCFNYTNIDDETFRKQVEAAMIFKHQPRCNVLGAQSYNYPRIWIETSGANQCMHGTFVVP